FGVLQEFHDFPQLVFRFVDAGDVAKPYFHIVVGVNLRPAAGEGHDAAFRASHATEEKAPERDEEDDGDDPADDFSKPFVRCLASELDPCFLQVLEKFGILDADGHKWMAALRPTLHHTAHALLGHDDLLNRAVADAPLKVAIRNGFAAGHREI